MHSDFFFSVLLQIFGSLAARRVAADAAPSPAASSSPFEAK